MLIAHVDFTVLQSNRDNALKALLDECPAVRAMPGCIAFQPFANPQDPARLGILHEWADEAAFNRYIASPGFAAVGEILRPMMTTAPVSHRFRAKMIETVA